MTEYTISIKFDKNPNVIKKSVTVKYDKFGILSSIIILKAISAMKVPLWSCIIVSNSLGGINSDTQPRVIIIIIGTIILKNIETYSLEALQLNKNSRVLVLFQLHTHIINSK